MDNAIRFIIIDLFCGLGGTTMGYVRAMLNGKRIAKVVACVNHDPVQIKSHWLNHPDVVHFEEDIRTMSRHLDKLIALVEEMRLKYPNAKVILWASLECTNFSNAKGGQERDPDSRTLAHSLHMQWDESKEEVDDFYDKYIPGDSYIQLLKPDYVKIENVVEFQGWGPLASDGKPFYSRNGEYFHRWCADISALGYHYEWEDLNSADFGAYTRRNRLFGCFSRDEQKIVWPKPTHAKVPFNGLEKWKAVRDVLNFENKGESIINRKKALSDKSLGRIYKGLIKFIAKGDTSFLSLYYTSGGNLASVDDSGPTIPTKDRISLVQPEYFIHRAFGTATNQSVEEPAGSLTASKDIKMNLVETEPFMLNPSHGGHTTTVDLPCVVLVARQDKAPLYLIQAIAGDMAIPVYKEDSAAMVLIKQFMAVYRLSDITMRMLEIVELLRIQDLPEDYLFAGNQTEMKKGIGNSVVPLIPQRWAEAKALAI